MIKKIIFILFCLNLNFCLGAGRDETVDFKQMDYDQYMKREDISSEEYDKIFYITQAFQGYYENAIDFYERWPYEEDRPHDLVSKTPVLREFGEKQWRSLGFTLFDPESTNTVEELEKLMVEVERRYEQKGGDKYKILKEYINEQSFPVQLKRSILSHFKGKIEIYYLKKEIERLYSKRSGQRKKKKKKDSGGSCPILSEDDWVKNLKELGLSDKEIREIKVGKTEGEKRNPTKSKKKEVPKVKTPPSSRSPSPSREAPSAISGGARRKTEPSAKKDSGSRQTESLRWVDPEKFKGQAYCLLRDGQVNDRLRNVVTPAKELLRLIENSNTIEELKNGLTRSRVGANFEKLGMKIADFSLRINQQWRIIFNYKKERSMNKIYNVRIVDYHK